MCASAGSACITCGKYIDHNLKMSLRGRKERVKRGDEREIAFNVHKLMKTESEVGIKIRLSKV